MSDTHRHLLYHYIRFISSSVASNKELAKDVVSTVAQETQGYVSPVALSWQCIVLTHRLLYLLCDSLKLPGLCQKGVIYRSCARSSAVN